jgi:hypothetical protein
VEAQAEAQTVLVLVQVEQVLLVKVLTVVILGLEQALTLVAQEEVAQVPQVQIDPILVILINLMVVQDLFQQY